METIGEYTIPEYIVELRKVIKKYSETNEYESVFNKKQIQEKIDFYTNKLDEVYNTHPEEFL